MCKVKKLLNRYTSYISVLSVLILWQLAGFFSLLPKFIFPTPFEIIRAFIRDINLLIFHSKITLIETAIGLSLGIIIASILAILMDRYKIVYKTIYPLLILTQTVPTIAIAPILILWLGYDMTPKIVLIVLTTTFPIIISILDGFKHCDEDQIRLLKLMNANDFQILKHLKFPTSLGYFFAGLRVSVSYAFITAVVAEWLGGFEGLGVYMTRVKKAFEYDSMFAVIFLVSMISLLNIEIVKIIEKKVLKWKYIQ
ncbi:MAG: ABC transporter permease [Fusobacterium sp.]|uniref:ABC transporter permease n=1 Tax=Fusobacterium sp. TaxID=68766 RepID=UPI0026DAC779|nr:ABC transporter permease [Fusobacterium sp.]MDO4690193.1 ABC transporter permease [Fusobacterium sp.]